MPADPTPAESLANMPSRIGEVVAPWAARAPERPAIFDNGRSWTYGALAEAIHALRNWLIEKHVRPGDRVMVVNENCATVIGLLLAIADLDAWSILVSARLSDREIDEIYEHSEARRIIYTVDASPQTMALALRRGAMVERIPRAGTLALSPLNPAALPQPVEADPARQVAALVYTSGTTGHPKGVMLTHRNLLFMARVSGLMRQLGPEDRFFAVLPISHIVGLAVVVLGTLLHGGSISLCSRFSPASALNALVEDRVTIMLGVPPMYGLLAEYAALRGLESLSHPALRAIGACGAPLDPSIKAATERLFGMPLHNGYGITECSPTISQTRLDEPQNNCSVGRVLPGVEVKLIGRDGVAVGGSDVGEIRVRGPNVMLGYYKAAGETAAVIDAEGWFNTHDLGRMEGGQLFIVGRTKELIIRSGFNVYPAEIEAVLNAHPAVLQSAVVGRPGGGDEGIIAFVQLVSGIKASAAELAAFATRELAPYKRPTEIVLVDTLPAGSAGKIRKSELGPLLVNLAARQA